MERSRADAHHLDVNRVDQSHVALREGHRDEKGGGERDEEDLKELLPLLSEDREDGSRVLGRVVVLVDEPEGVDLVRCAVVDVEEVVEGDLPRGEAEWVRPGEGEEGLSLLVELEVEAEGRPNEHVGCGER